MTRHERRTAKVEGSNPRWITCEPCGKRGYTRKADARKVARSLSEVHTYRCRAVSGERTPLYHVGYLPARIIAGEVDRGTVYGGRS